MVDNRSAGFYGIGGAFNFKSGDPSGTAAKMSQEKYGSEAMYLPPAEGEEDGDIVLLDDGEIDVGDLAYTAFILDMDTKHLCSEDCKGLCPGCGVNLNQEPCRCKKQADPRWAALEQLLNKN